MSKRKMYGGLTGVTLPIFVQDSSSTTGAGLSLAHNTAGLVGEYRRQGQNAWTSFALSAGTLGTWSSGGWVASGGLTGRYEVGIPDAAVAAGVRWVEVCYRGAANMLPVLIELEVDAVNYQDSVRFGLTALPNANAGANGGLPTGDASGRVGIQAGTAAGQLDFTSGVVKANVTQFGGTNGTFAAGRPEVNTTHWGGTAVATATVRADVRQILGTAPTEGAAGRLAGAFTTFFNVAAPTLTTASVNQTGDSFALIGTPAGGTVGADLTRLVNTLEGSAGGEAFSNFAYFFMPIPWTAGERNQIRYRLGIDGTATAPTVNSPNLALTVRRNTAFANFPVFLRAADGTAVVGATVTGVVSKDGAAPAALTNAVVEVGSGLYRVSLTAAELNAASVVLLFTAAGALPTPVTLLTQG